MRCYVSPADRTRERHASLGSARQLKIIRINKEFWFASDDVDFRRFFLAEIEIIKTKLDDDDDDMHCVDWSGLWKERNTWRMESYWSNLISTRLPELLVWFQWDSCEIKISHTQIASCTRATEQHSQFPNKKNCSIGWKLILIRKMKAKLNLMQVSWVSS